MAVVAVSALAGCSSIEALDHGATLKRTIKVSQLNDLRSTSGSGSGIPSLSEQMSWREQAMASNRSFNPQAKPASVPADFEQVPWSREVPLISPKVEAILTSDFGWRGLYSRRDFHSGIDIAAEPGTLIYTPVSGEVLYVKHAGTDSGVVISDGERQHTFWHTTPRASLKEGQWVKAGQSVGDLVAWGARTHLHYSVHLTGPGKDRGLRNDGNAIDPLTLVRKLKQTIVPLDAIELSRATRNATHRALLLQAARTPLAVRYSKPKITLPKTYKSIVLNIPKRELGYMLQSNGYSVQTLLPARR